VRSTDNFLALTDENGRQIWISAARPGRTHDATTARHDHTVQHLKAAGLGALADLAFLGWRKARSVATAAASSSPAIEVVSPPGSGPVFLGQTAAFC